MRAALLAVASLVAIGILVPRYTLADERESNRVWGAKIVLTGGGGGGGRPVPGWGHSSSPSWGYGHSWGHYPTYRYGYPYQSSYWANPVVTPIVPVAPTQVARVLNPATNGVNLTFMVNNQRFSLAPGMQQELNVGPGSYIEFDRGQGAGLARYSLEGANFTFTPTQSGWELFRTPFDLPTNIASGNPPVPNMAPGATQSTLPAASAPQPIKR